MLAAVSRDWEDVRALTHCAIKNAHCTDGAHSVGEDDATASLPYPSSVCLDTDNRQRSLS